MTADDWKSQHWRQVRKAGDAIERIGAGARVFIGSAAGEPQTLGEALAEKAGIVADTEIVHIFTLGVAAYADAKFSDHFRHNAFFIGDNTRDAVGDGRADYTPIFLSELPKLFRSGRVPIDVALIQVTPPDPHGYCSFGVSVDITKIAAECARLVIAEVNPNMPRTLGDSFIHVSEIDFLVPSDRPILESVPPEPSEEARRIGEHIASLVEDGSTLQTGYGGIPNAALAFLKDRKDLGIHTEMFSDGLVDLIECGAVTNARKTLHRGKVVASFVMGSRRLYDFVDNNPMIEFHTTDYTNDPAVIGQNDKMVAINGALEVDLTGQVCADSLGYQLYSGIGGHLDFIRGAARSRGGKPIVALPSTAEHGHVSRIVPHVTEGGGVVTTRGDVHYVVTEWGVADLYGKNIRERALALISIAHPKFRAELLAEAKSRRRIYVDQVETPLTGAVYPRHLETRFEAEGGLGVLVRPMKATDEALLREMLYRLSTESVYHRFFGAIKAFPHRRIQQYLDLDYDDRMAIVAIVGEGGIEKLVGVGRYMREPGSNSAECAFVVEDAYQGRGIGTLLLRRLVKIAADAGLVGFRAEVLADNIAMLRTFQNSGYTLQSKLSGGVYSLSFTFDTYREPEA